MRDRGNPHSCCTTVKVFVIVVLFCNCSRLCSCWGYSVPEPWIMGELLKTRIETRVSAHPALDSYLESGEKLKPEPVE